MNTVVAQEKANVNIYTGNPMFAIYFDNGGEDCTEFTVRAPANMAQVDKELSEFWSDFCKENRLDERCITDVVYMGNDPYYEKRFS